MVFEELILDEDDDILVVRKPCTIATETRKFGEADMVLLSKGYLSIKQGANPYLALLHRLDQPVEGVLLLAKNKNSAKKLSLDMKNGCFEKDYAALVHVLKKAQDRAPHSAEIERLLNGGEEELEDYIISDSKRNYSSIAGHEAEGSKYASLSMRLLKTQLLGQNPGESGDKRRLLLNIRLNTGRRHQIRVQLSNAGLPIVGDRKYGLGEEDLRFPLCLAAYRLSFIHPGDKKRRTYELPIEDLSFFKAVNS